MSLSCLCSPSARPAGASVPDAPFFEREVLSLQYNSRLLGLAETNAMPALEGVKLAAIVSRDVDELFQTRLATHARRITELEGNGHALVSRGELYDSIRLGAQQLVERVTLAFAEKLRPRLDAAGVNILDSHELSRTEQAQVRRIIEERIFPALTPLAFDAWHPFPFISDLSVTLAVVVRDPQTIVDRLVCVEVPRGVPRFLELADRQRFVTIEQAIGLDLNRLFPGMEVMTRDCFRVTRARGTDYCDPRFRRRCQANGAVRLEVTKSMPLEVRSILMRELALERSEVCVVDGLLGLADLSQLPKLAVPAVSSCLGDAGLGWVGHSGRFM